ncbi:MAG: hypothetical protein A3F67_00465 [Verrucomicrobia bacterium RIFCSPHIGHO2_12_FULL_41_10]|nr:MAG: hypothetical protein A3F67_00465 [Verrucomicrobia bacterium RIFCSPHIGHO2_12_FULL_41_10]HLB33844.1 SemiSWEET family transporter [Chthoniobacterales bacterium]
MKEKIINSIGWTASIMAIAMYFSYIDQIFLNLSGHTGSVILPIVTTINCITWVLYGWFKIKKDWPIIICNVLGIFIGIITAITAVI